MTHDINVVCDINIRTKGAVTENPDGSYTIFLAPWLDDAEREKVFRHELSHLADFGVEWDVQAVESDAHGRVV